MKLYLATTEFGGEFIFATESIAIEVDFYGEPLEIEFLIPKQLKI